MKKDKAVEAFLEKIIERSYVGSMTIINQMLEQGPPEKNPSPDRVKLHDWYENLDIEHKAMVQQVIQKVAFSALFGCLVVLDNCTGGYALDDEISDFALFVRSYADETSYLGDEISDMIQVNDLMNLHDHFQEWIEKNK